MLSELRFRGRAVGQWSALTLARGLWIVVPLDDGADMKLYDGGRAPNPRRVRIYLAEKGITVPIEQVDLGALQQKSADFTAINPVQRVPALVLDDGTRDRRIDRDLPLFRGAPSGAAAVRRWAPGLLREVEMWNRRLELHLLFPIAHVFRNTHPAMKEMEVPQVPAWAEANKPRIMDFLGIFDRELKDRPFAAGDRYTVADITGLVAVDFLKPAKLTVPDDLRQRAALACRSLGTTERERLTCD